LGCIVKKDTARQKCAKNAGNLQFMLMKRLTNAGITQKNQNAANVPLIAIKKTSGTKFAG